MSKTSHPLRDNLIKSQVFHFANIYSVYFIKTICNQSMCGLYGIINTLKYHGIPKCTQVYPSVPICTQFVLYIYLYPTTSLGFIYVTKSIYITQYYPVYQVFFLCGIFSFFENFWDLVDMLVRYIKPLPRLGGLYSPKGNIAKLQEQKANVCSRTYVSIRQTRICHIDVYNLHQRI